MLRNQRRPLVRRATTPEVPIIKSAHNIESITKYISNPTGNGIWALKFDYLVKGGISSFIVDILNNKFKNKKNKKEDLAFIMLPLKRSK